MGGDSSKENNRAEDLARQERERAAAEAAAIRQQQDAAAQQLYQQMQGVVAPSQFEQDTQASITGIRPEYESLIRLAASGGTPLNTPLGMALQERLLADLNRNPDDTFAPNLQLLQGQVGQFAARRGIVGSGLELEQLGRTGVELAIQQAMAREQLRSDAVNRAMTGNQSLEALGAGRRGELGGYFQNLQALEDARRAREVGALSGAATSGANLRSSGNLAGLDRLVQGNQSAGAYQADQLAAQRQARQSQQAAMGRLAGTAAGVATSFIPGVGPMLAPLVMSGINGVSPTSGTQLRDAQRKPSRLSGGYDDFYQRYV